MSGGYENDKYEMYKNEPLSVCVDGRGFLISSVQFKINNFE